MPHEAASLGKININDIISSFQDKYSLMENFYISLEVDVLVGHFNIRQFSEIVE